MVLELSMLIFWTVLFHYYFPLPPLIFNLFFTNSQIHGFKSFPLSHNNKKLKTIQWKKSGNCDFIEDT